MVQVWLIENAVLLSCNVVAEVFTNISSGMETAIRCNYPDSPAVFYSQ
jgi:hypothetical protein